MIASVSATDSSNYAVNATADVAETANAINHNSLGTENDGDILGDGESSEVGTFADLRNNITGAIGGTVLLENDYEYSITDAGTVGINIPGSLTIDGQGHKIDAKGKSSIFSIYLTGNYDITFKNIIFLNGKSSYGGAIYWAPDGGDGKIINCTFINNTATEYGGAAVYEYDGISEIVNCTFINNSATGGSVLNLATTNVFNSIFINNVGTDIEPNDDIDVITANNCWFGNTVANKESRPTNVDNRVTVNNWYYLDLYVDKENGDATVSLKNEDGSNYALPSIKLNVEGINITVPNTVELNLDNNGQSTFSFQPAEEYSITVSYNGVVLSKVIRPNTFTVLKDLIENSAEGVVYLDQDYAYSSTKDTTITNGIEIAKSITIDGNGYTINANGLSNIFYINNESNSITLRNINFVNAVGDEGSVVYARANNVEIINCTFVENVATGSLVYIDATGNISNSIFINNTASINVKGTGNVISDSNWWGNTFENYNTNISKTEGTSVNNWFLLNMTIDDDNSVVTVSLNSLYDGNNVFTSNYALPNIICNIESNNITTSKNKISFNSIEDSTFTYELISYTGFIKIYCYEVILLKEMEFVDDGSFNALQQIISFASAGDVIELTKNYTYSDKDKITNGILINKKITINGNGNTLDAKAKSRIFNIAKSNVGVELNNINFVNGKSDYGGAIQLQYHSDNHLITNCNFTNNTVTKGGGAIYCVSKGIISNCRFMDNTASYGGAIDYYHDEVDVCQVIDCIFVNNTGSGYGGGAIYAQDGTIDVDSSIFIKNIGEDASVISTQTPASVSDCIFLDNLGRYILMGYSTFTADRNWFGNTIENYDESPNIYFAVTINSWRYLDINLTSFKDTAVININNGYDADSKEITDYSYYGVPEVTLKISNNENLTIPADEVILKNGKFNLRYELTSDSGLLNVTYNDDINVSKEIKKGNFTKLQELIDSYPENSVVELDRDYTYTIGYEYLKEGIVIDKNITIDGKGHKIDAGNQARIFNVQATGVTFKNITFVNGQSFKGSAINLEIDNTEPIEFNVINCTFTNNIGTLTYYDASGAIRIVANSGNYNIKDSTFINNAAPSAAAYGGAIYIDVENAIFNIDNCTFINNTAREGGAIGISTRNSASSINYTTFINNSKDGFSTIYFKDSDGGSLLVNNSVLLNNRGSYVINNEEGNTVADYNWWGNIAGNYQNFYKNNLNTLKNGKPKNWVFINSTLESATMYIGNSSTAKLFFQLYDTDTGEITDFDYNRLPKLNITLTSEFGELDKKSVFINEEFNFTANEIGSANINTNILGFEYIIDITVKQESFITLLNDTIFLYFGDNPYLSQFATLNHEGKLIFESSNPDAVEIAINTFNNKFQFVKKYAEGEAIIAVSYAGDAYHDAAETKYFTVKIIKIPVIINITNLDGNNISVNVDDIFNLTVELNVDLQGVTYHSGYTTPSLSHLKFVDLNNTNEYDYNKVIDIDKNKVHSSRNITITAKTGGTVYLTLYYDDSNSFNCQNLTVNITVNRIKTKVTIDEPNTDTLPLKVEQTYTVSASVNVTGGNVEYYSSNPSIVSVNKDAGVLNPQGNGTVIITAKYGGNATHENSSATLTVIVTKYETTTTITSDKELELKVGNNSDVIAILTSTDVSFAGNINYISSNESVAIVDSNGKITAVGEGTAIITAKYDGNYKYANSSDSVSVVVSKVESSITLSTVNPLEINVFDEAQIVANLDHEGSLLYVSSNPNVVTVNQTTGKITAKAGGRANITISYGGNDMYAKAEDVNLTVIVSKLPSHITVENAISVDVDANNNISATVDNGRSLHYVSANPSIVTVNEYTGVITGVIGGTANVTVIFDEDGQYLSDSVNVTVTVNKLKSTFTIENPAITVDVYGNALIQVSSNNDGEMKFASCDASIVTVDGNIVTALKCGKVNVTLSVPETDRCLANETNVTVTVNKLQSTINVANEISVYVDESKTIGANVNENRQLRYVSADSGIVVVNANGVITGVIGGCANVTVIFDEDDQYLGSEVNVTVTVNKLEAIIDVEPISVDVYQNKSLNAKIISDGDISYVSTNPGIASVNETGYVTGVIGGKANITIAVGETNRYLAKSVNVTVTVNKLPSIFTNGPMSLSVDENATINSTLDHNGSVHYEFDSTKLNVTEDGLVIALAGGVHTINVIFDGNEIYLENSSTVTVTVSRLPADYENEPINLTVFETSNIEFLIIGYDHTNSEYSSSNETVFTVDNNGLITALAGGSALLNIKFPETDRYLGNSINITVNVKKLPSIFTGDNQISVKVDETKSLPVSVGHNRQLIYESSNPNIVTVDNGGLIRGIIGGTAFITVRYEEDGQYLANSTKISVTVNKLPSNIVVETQTITMYIDDNATVIATTDNDGGLFFTTNSSIISLAGDGKVTGLSEGTANVIIAVFETDTHLSNRTTLKVTVKKIPTAINVEELQLAIDVNDNQLINARLNHTGASGLTYTSSNPEVVAVDGDGRITALIGGQANITISYAGDDKFVAAEDVIVNVISNKLPTVIEVNDTFSLKVDDTVPIGASINHNGSQLKYTISNSSVITIDEATGEITAIGAGLVNITISCEETDKYLKAEDVTVSVEVTKFETIINVDNENPVEISVFDESVIIASLNYPQAGELTYASSDENVVTVDDEGIITAIGGGNANITISYDGNGKYAAAEKITINVVVNKLSSQIFVDDAISIDVYSFKSLNAYMETGRPLRYISNNESIAIVDEYGVVKGIVGGKTIITVIFEGDSEYEGCEVNVTVTVNKLSSKIDVESQQLVVEVGSNVEIIATTNSDADLRYLSLNSTIASVNGIVVTGVVGGTVNVTVSVPECDKYLADEVNVTITVIKHQSVINIESATLTVDVDGTVNIIATTNSDANLTYVSLNSSVASVDGNVVTGVIGGTVNITVSVPESDRYLASEANVTVVVNKLQSVINIESYSLVVDVDGSVNIIASTNSDGNLDYESLDTSIATVDANVVRGVIGGTVKVRVSVDETERYLANEANVTVVVNKLQSVINIESYSLVVDVDGSVLINASSDSDAGLTYASLDSSIAAVEGNAVTGISSGIVNVTVSVGETGRYLAKDVNVTVTVNKAKSVISANNITVYVDGTKSIDATLNVAGSLRYINRNPEIVSIDESGMVKGIIGGTANITIIFDETNKYLGSEINVTVTVNKLQPVIDLESDSLAVEVEGNVLINASTNSDAGLIYESLDESVATVNLNNVTALIGGKVIVRVSVPESDRYLAKSVNVTVAVKKHDSIIIIENDEISVEVDGKQQIVASTNSDSPIIFFTMSPIVSIGGTGVVTGISNGTAEVLLNVAESDKYSSNTSVVVVKVNKIPTAIMVNESISVTVDDEINLNATLDHEGQLSFTSLNESIASVDAKGNIKAVKVGKTQIIVSFEENDKYLGNSITVDVTVNKIDIPINDTISMDLQDASRTPTFSIDLPNATGNFSVIVDGKEIGPVSLKDGKANITVPELAYGSHNVTVVYSGDDKYDSIAQNTTVNITKPVLSENKDIAMLYTANDVYKVHVTVDGKAIVGQNVTFKFNGKTYDVKTDKNGYAAFKLPTAKPKKAKYAITATFHNVTVKNNVKVNSIIKAKNLKIKKSRKVVKIKVSLKKVNGKYLKGKQLKLKIKGKTLKAKTNKKGVATFKLKKNVLKKLKVGKKYKYRVSYGKDVVTKKLKVKR
ncbi:Ig-like domain-containing protein [Methanobrevibacter sp. UBA212]|uniref:Ig-like domain-containing protein n=1 Tax=Methanobrevibacter sp. UBA212 TaxID=1915476 RepID=UPI0025FA14DB|nr:Ig-like domain-containing protein [Methanobrevibacter sp. UBA212]